LPVSVLMVRPKPSMVVRTQWLLVVAVRVGGVVLSL